MPQTVRSGSSVMTLCGRSPASNAKPALLMVVYGNPDYYPPTTYAVKILREYFAVYIVGRNISLPAWTWPADVSVERVGRYGAEREKANASSIAKLLEFAGFVLAVRRAARRLDPRLIYAYDPLGLAATLLGGNGTNAPTPIVYHCHDQPQMDSLPPSSLQTWMTRYAMRRASSAALVVYPEKLRAEYYEEITGDGRPPAIVPNYPTIDVVPRPADFAALIDRRWSNREILHTGIMGDGVGVLEAVRALSSLEGKPRLRLFGLIRGDDFPRKLAEVTAGLGLEPRVINEGWASSLDAVFSRTMESSVGLVLYRGCATVNERYRASATNKLFEYGARGIPAIVPDTESFREFLVGESWVEYADPSDPASIAKAIGRVFEDRERYSTMCRAARRAFEERFNYERAFAPVLRRILSLANGADAEEQMRPAAAVRA